MPNSFKNKKENGPLASYTNNGNSMQKKGGGSKTRKSAKKGKVTQRTESTNFISNLSGESDKIAESDPRKHSEFSLAEDRLK